MRISLSFRSRDCEVFSVWTESDYPKEGGVKTCVVHIAETGELKCSRRSTVVTTPIATVDASTAGPASAPKRGQYVGAALTGSGRDPALYGRDGGIGGRQLCVGNVRLRRAEWLRPRLRQACFREPSSAALTRWTI